MLASGSRAVHHQPEGRATTEGAAMTGKVVHFEIPFADGERARTFYREAFGWDLQSMPEMGYTGVSTGPTGEDGMPTEPGYIGGGMFERDGELTSPIITIDCDDIDTAIAQMEKAGGSVVRPPEPVGDFGRAAYFRDPEGNVVGLWQSLGQDG
jgi:predicted enzyme related to lactoylglutathione lyase